MHQSAGEKEGGKKGKRLLAIAPVLPDKFDLFQTFLWFHLFSKQKSVFQILLRPLGHQDSDIDSFSLRKSILLILSTKIQTKKEHWNVVFPILLLLLLPSKLTFKDNLFVLLWGNNKRSMQHSQDTTPKSH